MSRERAGFSALHILDDEGRYIEHWGGCDQCLTRSLGNVLLPHLSRCPSQHSHTDLGIRALQSRCGQGSTTDHGAIDLKSPRTLPYDVYSLAGSYFQRKTQGYIA